MNFKMTSRCAVSVFAGILTATGLAGCTGAIAQHSPTPPAAGALFVGASERIAFDTANRRQWGAPVVADMDGDGWDDIIINDHGHAAILFWNDRGVFSPPQTVIEGDVHGIGVEDYDADGRVDIVIARGGGDGENPRNPARIIVNRDRTLENAGVFEHFERGRGRAIKFLDADRDNALDLIYTGFAPRNADHLAGIDLYANRGGELRLDQRLPESQDAISFHMLVTDFENDHNPDLIVYAGREMIAVQGGADGVFTDVTSRVLGPLAGTSKVSTIAELDYDNDGDMDLFLTRAAKKFERESYFDPSTGRYAFFVFRDEFMVGDFEIDGDLVLENVQESYATHGVFVGSEKREVEADRPDNHAGGRLVIRPEDAQGWPEGELRGLHLGYLGDGRWRIGGNVHSRLAVVVENVISAPPTENRADLPAILLENRGGIYIDVTAEMGVDVSAQTSGAAVGDFDNDGWIDIALSYYGDMVHPVGHAVLLNRQGRGFERAESSGVVSDEIGAVGNAISAIDFDRDGRLDLVFGNERGRWHLARNAGEAEAIGNYIVLDIGRSPDANGAITGARVTLTACGASQHRVIGATGDGFHHMASGWVHFGIGECGAADNVQVTWANGENAILNDLEVNQAVSAGRPR